VKVAAQGDPVLPVEMIRSIVDEAHSRGLRTVAHALSLDSVRLALEAGIDALAHTPISKLPADLVSELGSRQVTVVSTLRAFGDSRVSRDNLAALAAAGCVVVYGTDLGNDGIEPGVDAAELSRLAEALESDDAALAAATSAAASFSGLPRARIAQGEPATLMLTDTLDPPALRKPHAMWIEGKRLL